MLIDFMPFKSSSLSKDPSIYQRVSDKVPQAFTSNNNLSIRLKKDSPSNLYNEEMRGGEDMYLCLSFLKQKKKYLIDDELKLYHRPRQDLKGIIKQFYDYGNFGADAFSKLEADKLELFHSFNLGMDGYSLLVKRSLPVKGLVYLDFFSLHLIALIFGILLLNQTIITLSFVSLFIYYLREIGLYFHHSFMESCKIVLVNYLVNWAFFLGGIKQSFTRRILFIPPSLHRSKYRLPARFYIISFSRITSDIKKQLYHIFDHHKSFEGAYHYLGDKLIRVQLKDENKGLSLVGNK